MKCRFVLKTPDALQAAIESMAEDEVGNIGDEEELDAKFDEIVEKYTKRAEKWFRYGELVKLEIDFDEDTCVVLENK